MNIWYTSDPVQLNRIFFLWILTGIICSIGFARQQEAIIVHPAVQSRFEARPGAVAAVTIKVTNNTPDQQSYNAMIILPTGWRLITRETPFDLYAYTNDVRLISFSVPTDAPAKTYQIRYLVHDHAQPVNEASTSIDVEIAQVIQFELKRFQSPRFAVAGTIFKTVFLLTNQGNAASSVQLTAKSSYGYPVKLDSSILNLSPKESREIPISITSDPVTEKVSHTLELEVKSRKDPSKHVSASCVIDIIPRITQLEKEYVEYPITAKLRGVGENKQYGTQAELSGFGSLSEEKKDRLEFLIRTPETQTISTLGQRDEYRVSYRTNFYEVYAGDHNFNLSTLTEAGRYSTGVGGRVDIKKFAFGGFYNTTRWTVPSQKETGGFVYYTFQKGNSIGLNVLGKSEQFSSTTATLQGFLTPLAHSALEIEAGTSVRDDKRGSAFSTRFEGSYQSVNYDIRYVHAEPNFGGYYRDIDFIAAGINTQVLRTMRIQSYIREEKRNLARDTNLVSAPKDAFYQIGASYSDFVALNFRRQIQRDRFDIPKYKRYEDVIQTVLRYNFSVAYVSANIDLGSTRDELLGKNSPSKRYALYANMKSGTNLNLGGSIELSKSRNIYNGEDQNRLSGNVNIWVLITQSTQFQLNLYRSKYDALTYQIYNVVDASLEHVFPSTSHKITIRGHYNAIAPVVVDNIFAYSVEYSIPIGVPIKRISNIGQLRGSLKDETGKGIANVLISIGTSVALTDRQGTFFFPSLKPGMAYILVDQAGIGLDRITAKPMPIEVVIRGGDETKYDIATTKSVSIAGKTILLSMREREFGDTSSALVELGGRAGVIMEISNGPEIFRRVTDNQGKFLFTDLRPGHWVLSVIGGDIPDYHLIQPDSVIIDLLPGEKKDVSIQIRQRKREIKMLQQGVIVQEIKQQPPPPPAKPCVINFNDKRKGFVLQISSWQTNLRALRDARRVEKLSGMKPFIEIEKVPNVGKRYRVYLGVFKTREEAESMCRRINTE